MACMPDTAGSIPPCGVFHRAIQGNNAGQGGVSTRIRPGRRRTSSAPPASPGGKARRSKSNSLFFKRAAAVWRPLSACRKTSVWRKSVSFRRGSTRGRDPPRVESNACKKPAAAGVCAAKRQLFGLRSRQKSEALFRLSKKAFGLFRQSESGRRLAAALSRRCGGAAPRFENGFTFPKLLQRDPGIRRKLLWILSFARQRQT